MSSRRQWICWWSHEWKLVHKINANVQEKSESEFKFNAHKFEAFKCKLSRDNIFSDISYKSDSLVLSESPSSLVCKDR